ncbi:four helix bundle protein [Pedobacter endophyticus]|uniref:Four helix bundle protein n=1 Tax=Pedobacter endophyticus TaxID=2789740 RepID=A0A7U3Q389_9SPHI|nr:four helix bundle protein [Pedobacter endophyticus]QPH37711.1 four helix bundle protein [Pedobacter endophyticus]
MGKFRDLIVYKKGFSLLMEIFTITSGFPKNEQYSLVDQIRRCSRSVCANLAEAYRKRKYPNHFVSKLSDSDTENGETQTWLEFALACKYITTDEFNILNNQAEEVAKLLVYMMKNPEKFITKLS